jgi:hypothetical protein
MIKIYIAIILNVVLCGCETLSLKIQVEYRFRVIKKRRNGIDWIQLARTATSSRIL